MEYKGYHAKYEIDEEGSIIVGKILGIADLVTFESKDVEGLRKEFESAVDDYLDFCKEVGKAPDKEYKGTFNVRITPERHRRAAIAAERRGISLNQFISDAVDSALSNDKKQESVVTILLPDIERMVNVGSETKADKYVKIIDEDIVRYEGEVNLG